MDRQAQFDICKRCLNCKFDHKRGIVCGKTDKKPDFTDFCPGFSPKEGEKNPFENNREIEINYTYAHSSGYTQTNSISQNIYFETSGQKKPRISPKPVKKRNLGFIFGMSVASLAFIRLTALVSKSEFSGAMLGILIYSIVFPILLVWISNRQNRMDTESPAGEIMSYILFQGFGFILFIIYYSLFISHLDAVLLEIFSYLVFGTVIGIPLTVISRKIILKHDMLHEKNEP